MRWVHQCVCVSECVCACVQNGYTCIVCLLIGHYVVAVWNQEHQKISCPERQPPLHSGQATYTTSPARLSSCGDPGALRL